MQKYSIALLLISLVSCGGPEKGPYDTDPTEPSAALETLHVIDGFRAELVASEPHVVDPVEIAFDESGGIYVAEMLDYPFDPESGEQPRSRIRYMMDEDGDGVVDDAVIFADNLLQATSVFPWKGGIFVASAPQILYFKDTDGDHVADEREVWYEGFDTNVSPEARITNFRLGVDNWIYAANNGRPGKITSPKFPQHGEEIIRGFDFRFHPVTGEFEPAAGPTQFGMSFNPWGARFVTQNTVHLRHAVIPARYALGNRLYSPPSMLHYVLDDDPSNSKVYPLTSPQQWRVERTAARQERYDDTRPGRKELLEGHFTAATGTTVFVGDALGEDVYGNVFVADANGGLVHRERLSDNGPTYLAEPVPAGGPELLASTDPWFRPVNMANAPDGSLWLLDFYREYIEEPASIPEGIKQRLQLDFYRGDDRGRIWRIVRAEGDPRNWNVDLGSLSSAELVETLAHANGWHRRTAQRLLLERQDASVAPQLVELLANGSTPEGRLQALWALEANAELSAEHVRKAIDDAHPGVRANAVRLAERFQEELPGVIEAATADSDPKVRFQAALSLGLVPSNAHTVAAAMVRESDDPWFRAALLTAVRERPYAVVNRLLTSHREFFAEDDEGPREMLAGLTRLVGAGGERQDQTLLLQAIGGSPRLRAPEWQAAALGGFAEGLSVAGERGLRVSGAETLFSRWLSSGDDEVRDAALRASMHFRLPGMLSDALRAAASEDLAVDRRARAVGFLRAGTFEQVAPVLEPLLGSPAAAELHLAALDTLAAFDEEAAAVVAMAGWGGYSPAVRTRATALLLGSKSGAALLLDRVESGAAAPSSVDPVAKIRLRQFPDAAISARAEQLFAQQSGGRAAVVDAHQDVLELTGNAEQGKPAFEKACAKCHVRQGERARLGPDLSGINNKTDEELLAHILDPSFEIAVNYTNYIIVARDGRILDGLLAGETADTVTLRGEYENRTIRRDEIEEMRASAVSLMPDGLEEDLSKQDLANVIAYLQAGL